MHFFNKYNTCSSLWTVRRQKGPTLGKVGSLIIVKQFFWFCGVKEISTENESMWDRVVHLTFVRCYYFSRFPGCLLMRYGVIGYATFLTLPIVRGCLVLFCWISCSHWEVLFLSKIHKEILLQILFGTCWPKKSHGVI